MTVVGFVGLGVMGKPMAHNLLAAGWEVVAHNRSAGPVRELEAAGATAADSPADTAQRADIVLTCLPDSPDVESVVLGRDGVLAAADPPELLIDTSTVRPATALAVSEAAAERGVAFVDAPISGGEQGAIDATLSIMTGGTDEGFAAAEPVLACLGATVVRVGPPGAGQTVKAANQLLVAGIIELVGEALLLLERSDVDMDAAVRVLSGGMAGNAILERKGAAMRARRFDPGFRVDLHRKDVAIVLDLARQLGVSVPVTGITAQLLEAAAANGLGGRDHSALLAVLERLAGDEGGSRG